MEDPAELDARALRLEQEADNLEQAGRNAAAQGRLQQAKSLRDQATLQRQTQGCIHTSSLIPFHVCWSAFPSIPDTSTSSPHHCVIMLITMVMLMSQCRNLHHRSEADSLALIGAQKQIRLHSLGLKTKNFTAYGRDSPEA